MFKINIFIGGSIMKIINYSITIELTMPRSLRFPYGCDMRRADEFFVNHRYISVVLLMYPDLLVSMDYLHHGM